MAMPVPVSPPTSEAMVEAMAERGITWTPSHVVRSLDPVAHVARLKDSERRYDLFVGVPAHRVPTVVSDAGLTEGGNDGWVKVDPRTLETPFPGVYAIGDCADAPVPRAGVFAESAARTLARRIEAVVHGKDAPAYDGTGSCYIEFGDGTVAKVEADFLSGPGPVAPYFPPSAGIAAEKAAFAAERRQRWFRGATN
jgi:sulfide:quinone oxidoreductase